MERMIVVGGGIVGSLLAVYLARRGHEVEVWERHPDTGGEGGQKRAPVNITLCERGLRALDAVGLREPILALTVPAQGRLVHAADGGIAYQPYGRSGEAIYSVSRAALSDALMNFARAEPGVRFRFNQKCVRLDLREGSVRFQDTASGQVSEVRGDRIFAADGAFSTVRAQLQRTEQFNYSQQYWKQRAYVSLRIPARADGTPALDGNGLHVWPRGNRMLIGFPNTDGSILCSLMIPLKGEDSFASLSTPERVRSFFERAFPDAAEVIPQLAEQFFAHPPNSMLTVRCSPWSYGDRVLLVGDAAHAVLPSYGQGANAGFEDCRVLDECMAQHGSDWARVFAAFESQRKPSMDAMADLCIEHFEELFDLVGDPAFLKRREIERRIHELYPGLFRPLYSMIAFTCMPYEEALRSDQRQRAVIDRIMRLDDVENRLHAPEVRRLLDEANAGDGAPRACPTPPGASGNGDGDADARPILDLAFRFWDAKALLSAVELGIFGELSRGPRTAQALAAAVRLQGRGTGDFFDALVSLGLLSRSGDQYENTPRTRKYLIPDSPSYIGGTLELANSRLYPVWGKLSDGLRSGQPQNEAQEEPDYYGNLTRYQDRLRTFLSGMTGLSLMAARAIAAKFPWQRYATFADIGGAQGALSTELVRAHPHLTGTNFELPAVEPYFHEQVAAAGLADRVRFHGGDFFAEPLPGADVIIMGHVLHNWSLERKRLLVRKAFDALPPGGALIVYEALIDDARSTNSFGLLMSLNMLLVTSEGFVFTGAECSEWMRDAGFSEVRVEHLHGPDSMVVGIK